MFGNIIGDSTGITQWLLNMAVTLTFLSMIAHFTPSSTPQYNLSYFLMHVAIIYVYVVSLLLNPRLDLQQSAVNNLDVLDKSLVVSQVALFIFMCLVSFKKIKMLWPEARAQVHRERVAEARVKEHMVYFEKLRLYFSDSVAIALTNAHHYGGFGAIIGDMAEKSEDQLDQQMGKVWRQKNGDTVENPLQEVGEASSTSGSDNEAGS